MSLEDVKTLRDRTGAGLMDCKNALAECMGNIAEAEKLLQKKGLAAATIRAGRPTTEGRLFIKHLNDEVKVTIVKCETDFVANNEDFIALGDVDDVSTAIDKLKVSMRENISLSLQETLKPTGVVSTYVHSDNKTGAVVSIIGANDELKAKEFAHDCCLHLVAFTPAYIKRSDVPESYIAEKTEIFKAQMDADPKMASKPDKVKDGIILGKVNKHLAEVCFEDQAFVKDDKKSVSAKLAELGKDACFEEVKLYLL